MGTGDTPQNSSKWNTPRRAVLIYALCASAWIIGTGLLIDWPPTKAGLLEISKGLAFVLVTSLFLYTLIHRHVARLRVVEDARRQSEGLYWSLVRTADEGIWILDHVGKTRFVNQRMADLLSYQSHELLDHTLAEFIVEPTWDPPAAAKQTNGDRRQGDYRFRRCDGSFFWGLVLSCKVELDADKPAGMLVLVTDITQRKESENHILRLNRDLEQRVISRTEQLQSQTDQLRQHAQTLSQRTEALTERDKQLTEAYESLEIFSSSVSHALRKPLEDLAAGLEQAMSVAGENAADPLRRAVARVARMDSHVEELLQFARLSHGKLPLEPVSLITAVTQVVGRLEQAITQRQAKLTIGEPLPQVQAHRATLLQILANLLDNALRFVPANRQPDIHVWTQERPGWVRLWISDNGPGIPAGEIADIFEPFRGKQLDQQHWGLGLAIVRQGISRMGGQCGVQSDGGSGSQFWIELPRNT